MVKKNLQDKAQSFKVCYLFVISGTVKRERDSTVPILKHSIDEVIKSFVTALCGTLPDNSEEIKVEVGKIDCDDMKKEHKCLTKIKLAEIED